MKTTAKNIAFLFFVILLIAGCKKKDDNTTNGTADPDAKQHNEDISNIKSESDNVNTDVNNVLSSVTGFGKNGSIEAISICGATIDSSDQYDPIPTLYINFDGTTTCPNPSRIRSGQIKLELIQGNAWVDQGAVLRVTHIDYKVTFPSLNNHYVTFNGVKYLTNVSGINWVSVYLGATIQLRERSNNMTVTFENGQVASWNIARLSTWGIRNQNLNDLYAEVNGDTIIGGKTIDSWGVTRFGTNFQTEMIQPWKSGTQCGWWKPTSGKYTSTTTNFSVTATFGVDKNGNSVSSGCPGYFKLNWNIISNGNSGEAVISYF